jgi:microcystin-dependent protein
MSEPFIGQIILFAGNFAPRGYQLCNGQLLSIAQNTALFSILGTTYGGNGQTTFALPDLRGRAPIHFGQGPGLDNYSLGQSAGQERGTLNSLTLPAHNHVISATATVNASARGSTDNVAGAVPATGSGGAYAAAPDGTTTMNTNMVTVAATAGIAGGSQPFEILQPYLVLNYCIATEGIFPSRN